MEYVLPILTGISLSACTGFRAFLPPFLIGLIHKFFPQLGLIMPKLAFLSQTPVLTALGIAVIVEFLGDKIPWVDNFLDLIQLPVKTVITILLTYFIIPSGEHAWVFLLLALIIGSSTTVAVHAGKSGIRAASSASTGGALNPIISLAEEFFALVGTIVSVIFAPLAVLLMVYIVFRCFSFLFGSKGGNDGKIAESKPSFALTFFVRLIIRFSCGIFNRLEVLRLKDAPKEGPFVIIANHTSMLDGFLIGATAPIPVFIMVKQEAFENPVVGWFLRKTLAFPVDRDNPHPTTIKMAFQVLQEKHALLLFPEGTRSLDGKLRIFKPGALKIALKKKARIVPAYIANAHLFMPPGVWVPRPVKITVRYGPPIELTPLIEKGLGEEEIQKIIFDAVCELGRQSTGKEISELIVVSTPIAETQESPPLSASA